MSGNSVKLCASRGRQEGLNTGEVQVRRIMGGGSLWKFFQRFMRIYLQTFVNYVRNQPVPHRVCTTCPVISAHVGQRSNIIFRTAALSNVYCGPNENGRVNCCAFGLV
jgi:hypothetical protein